MREFAKVVPQFWTGDTGRSIRALGRDAQVTALYLLTAPTASALGLYYLPIPTLAHETGIAPQGALKALRSLFEVYFSAYDAPSEWVFVYNMARFQIGDRLKPNDKRLVWIRRELETLAKCPFYNDFLARYRDDFDLHELSPSEAPSETHRSKETETETETETENNSARKARSKPHWQIWFEEVLQPAYPEHRRQSGEKTAIGLVKKLKPDTDQQAAIQARLERWKASEVWAKQDGEFVPGIGKFFSEGYCGRDPDDHHHRNGKPVASRMPTADEYFEGVK